MAQAELVLVGSTHALGGLGVFTRSRQLLAGVVHGVPRQAQVFGQLTQGVVADVQGLVDLVRVGLQASLVAAAAEQVVVHLHAGLPVVVVVAFLAAGVVVGTGSQNGVEARVEGRLADFVLLLGGVDVSLGGFDVRVVLAHAFTRLFEIGRHFHLDRLWAFQLVRHAADDAEEVGLGIGQVDFGGVQVVFRQGATCAGLVKVGGAADAALVAQADLVVHSQVGLQVVLGQGYQFTALEHFQVHLDCTQGDILGNGLGVVGAGGGDCFGAAHFIRGVEAVEDHLPQAQLGLGVVEGFLVVVTLGTGRGVVRALAAVTGNQVHGRVVATTRELHVFIGRQLAVTVGADLWVVVHGALDSLGNRHRLYVGTRQGQQ
ncbi:hypothetical protein D3C75_763080 [compost metagenome]